MADDPSLEAVARTTASSRPWGLTEQGFVPKPLARLLDEKIAAAQVLFGDDVDLTSASPLRKLAELIAMDEARLWAALGSLYDSLSVATATGDALSIRGAELGISRPHERAEGVVTIGLAADLPAGIPQVALPAGTRLTTPGGHDYTLDEPVTVTNAARTSRVRVVAFNPGPGQNLDPTLDQGGVLVQRLDRFDERDGRSADVRIVAAAAGADVITITHDAPTTGGERFWSDERYRDLLLAYPRNLWTPDAVRVAVALVPGVRQVVVKDLYGGLDINQSIFGNFSFVERLFSEERSLGDPYFFTVLVAPEAGAIWDGPGQLRARVREAVDAVRPIGVLPKIEQAPVVGVGFSCQITVEGLPVPAGRPDAIGNTPEAVELKGRIFDRVRRHVRSLGIGEPVHYSEVLWALMEELGVLDATQVRLRRYPPQIGSANLTAGSAAIQSFACEQDVDIGPTEVAELVEALEDIRVV